MSEEELYKLLNIPYKPWIELTDEEIQLFEKNNNYIKQLQQENKEKQDKLDKIEEKLNDYSCIYNQGFPFTLLLAIRGGHPNDNQYLELDKVIEDFRKIMKGEDK